MHEDPRGLRFGIVEFNEPLQTLSRNYSIWNQTVNENNENSDLISNHSVFRKRFE
jgi:hypothetical protein